MDLHPLSNIWFDMSVIFHVTAVRTAADATDAVVRSLWLGFG